MMRSVRKNFFNLVVICDPSKAKCRPLIKMLESFYLHRAPTRIGIIFAVNPDMENASGENDAGVAFLNAYNWVRQEHSSKDALAFITKVYETVDDEGQDVSVGDVQDVFKGTYGSSKVCQWVLTLGFRNCLIFFVLGKLLNSIKNEESATKSSFHENGGNHMSFSIKLVENCYDSTKFMDFWQHLSYQWKKVLLLSFCPREPVCIKSGNISFLNIIGKPQLQKIW